MRLAPLIRVLVIVALGLAAVYVVASRRGGALAAGDPLELRNTSGTDVVAVIKTPSGTSEQFAIAPGASVRGRFDPGMALHVFVGEAKGLAAGSWTISAIAGPLDIEVGGEELAVGIAADGLDSQDAPSLHINAP